MNDVDTRNNPEWKPPESPNLDKWLLWALIGITSAFMMLFVLVVILD